MNVFLRITLILSVPLAVAMVTLVVMRHLFVTPLSPGGTEVKLVEVQPDRTFRDICNLLEEEGIVRSAWGLELLASVKRSQTAITAGEYQLSPGMTPSEVLARLASGEVLKRVVIVPEGISVWEVGALVEQAGLLRRDEFEKAVADRNLLAVAGISAQSFEGYLFPGRYELSRPTTPKNIVFTMLEAGEKQWPAEYSERADKLNLTRHEILTLASIIQRETTKPDDMPTISSVFHNRLSQGMKLQSDPTVAYGIPNFKGLVTKDDQQNPHPYNTWINFGLPPGPICNPGPAAIAAALRPATTPYLFFARDGAGNLIFSTTLQEHTEAIRRIVTAD